MRKGSVVSLFVLLMMPAVAYEATAQTPGTCPRTRGEAYLDVNNVRARIFNNGALFWRGAPHVYEVPKGGGTHAIFASGIWIAGLIEGEIRAAGARYGEWEFWAGPLDNDGNPPNDCLRYDRLWEITRKEIAAFNETGVATKNLLDWPWRLGAPVIDGDGLPNNYNLDGGDRPALIGDQMIWWVMNDVGGEHLSIDTQPIGMEVHGTAFAFHRPGSYIDNVTFYRYQLIHKGREPFEDAYFSIYADPDLGFFADDYVASDSTLHLGYVYNADNLDEDCGYGAAPPALGYTFLRSALADADGRDNDRDDIADEPGEQIGMSSFLNFGDGGCVICSPLKAQDYYYYMQARWKNGQPLTVGGNYGLDFSDIPTHFSFPGDPVTGAFWSEFNTDGQGTAKPPGDRHFLISTGPFTLQPGQAQEILFAIVWSRGTDHLDSVRQLKKDVKRLREVADAILVPDVPAKAPDPVPEPVLGFAQNYPNPFNETTTIRYSVPLEMAVRLRVYDVLGREITTLVDERLRPGIYTADFDGAELPRGLYVYRIEMAHMTFTRRMMLVR